MRQRAAADPIATCSPPASTNWSTSEPAANWSGSGRISSTVPLPVRRRSALPIPRPGRRPLARYDRAAGTEGKWTTAADLPADVERSLAATGVRAEADRVWPLGAVSGTCRQLALARQSRLPHAGRELKVLNLFAYTGGATLAMAAAGAQRGPRRQRARQRGLGPPQRRAVGFVGGADPLDRRGRPQVRPPRAARGNRYDAVVLDPPSYGHGPKGEPWKFDVGLAPLVRDCFELTRDRLQFMFLSCHTPGFSTRAAHDLFVAAAAGAAGHVAVAPVELSSTGGRRLSCGIAARWQT